MYDRNANSLARVTSGRFCVLKNVKETFLCVVIVEYRVFLRYFSICFPIYLGINKATKEYISFEVLVTFWRSHRDRNDGITMNMT